MGWIRGVVGWMKGGVPILSPEWGDSPIAQRRKPWEHRQHQHPTAPDGATEFTGTSHSSARYGAIQAKCFRDPQGLRHWATLAVAPFGALAAAEFGGSTHTSTELSMSGGLGSAVASLQHYSVLQRGDCVPPHVHSSSVPSRLWLPLPTDGCEATSSFTHLGEGGG